jgi:hypothetical protein
MTELTGGARVRGSTHTAMQGVAGRSLGGAEVIEVGGGAGVGVTVDSRPRGGRRKNWGKAEATESARPRTSGSRRDSWTGRGPRLVESRSWTAADARSGSRVSISASRGRGSSIGSRSALAVSASQGSLQAHRGSDSRQGHRVRIEEYVIGFRYMGY